MKLASFRLEGRCTWGLVDAPFVVDVGAALAPELPDLRAAIAAQAYDRVGQAAANARRVPLEAVSWEPVIPNPDKIICIGLNYEDHRKETGRATVGYPTVFTRFANTQTGHLCGALLPRLSVEFDYEGELAVIIGKRGRYIREEDARSHIAGYSCYNDMSVRDWQRHTHQFAPGKNFPGTGAFGPWLVTTDEVGDLGALRLQTRVDGEVLQSALLGDMIFSVPELIAYCSSFTCLEPGDVIVTGTPGGVGAKRTPPRWLRAGEITEVEIERIGVLRNRIVAEARDAGP